MKTLIATILACLPLAIQAQSTELICWTVNGTLIKLTAEEGILKIPDSVAAVYLNAKAITLDCSSANPNCLYYTDNTTAVKGLPNANVVINSVCDGLVLTDTAYFYCPLPFTATDAMLRLTPRRDDGNDDAEFDEPCYETVMLPFDADFVIPADADGPMPHSWCQVANYVGFYDNILTFSQTDDPILHARTPYLIRFAYGAYGTQILFCGQDKIVNQTKTAYAGQEPFYFAGITTLLEEGPTDYRYRRGQNPYFVHTGDRKPMEPFRCFITSDRNRTPNDITIEPPSIEDPEPSTTNPPTEPTSPILNYIIVGGQPTGIDQPSRHRVSQRRYDLQGRPLYHDHKDHGVYIAGGIKVIR